MLGNMLGNMLDVRLLDVCWSLSVFLLPLTNLSLDHLAQHYNSIYRVNKVDVASDVVDYKGDQAQIARNKRRRMG